MKIAVIAGGLSPERDVSLTSGALIAESLTKAGHRVALADLFFGVEIPKNPDDLFVDKIGKTFSVSEKAPNLDEIRSMKKGTDSDVLIGDGIITLCRHADIVFLALHGGAGENGQFQALLDLYGVRYTGSSYAGALLAMDKDISKAMLRQAGVVVPEGISLPCASCAEQASKERIAREVGFPCVVKPSGCGSSIGVSIVETAQESDSALRLASVYEGTVLVERKIVGREFSVGVLNGVALPPIEIIPLCGFYDYKNKYQAGMTEEVCPAQLTEDETKRAGETALAVHHALHLGSYSRVDMILEKDSGIFYALEANTLPGMTPSSLLPQEAAAAGIDYVTLCDMIAKSALN